MTQKHTCPRRAENGTDRADSPFRGSGPDLDTYKGGHGLVGQRRGCSYCGSMSGDDFMESVRAGTKVGPTDKSYKFYVGDHDGKFYTPHLSHEQADEFLELWLTNKVHWGYPGYPHVRLFLPVTPAKAAE